jgi:hypothetical protein
MTPHEIFSLLGWLCKLALLCLIALLVYVRFNNENR